MRRENLLRKMVRSYQNNICKKALLTFLWAAFFLFSQAQTATAIYADPAVISFDITTVNDGVVDPNNLFTGTVYKLKLSIVNLDQAHPIPNGTCAVRIGLGSKMIVDPAYDLANAPFSNYFSWTTTTTGGQVQINGAIINTLPPDFLADLSFNVKAATINTTGSSTVSSNFLITNDNPAFLFSDQNPTNNSANLSYAFTFFGPLPVNITSFTAANNDCTINANWSVGEEINLSKYELEISNDGINFRKAGEQIALHNSQYSLKYDLKESERSNLLFLRIKSINSDATFKYSSIISVNGTCTNKNPADLYAWPNPLSGNMPLHITSRNSLFNGKYLIMIIGSNGALYGRGSADLHQVSTFTYQPDITLAAGKYFMIFTNIQDNSKQVISFEKL